MQRSEQITQAKRLLGYMDARTTALADDLHHEDTAAYVGEERWRREREMFFRKGLLNLGLSCRLPNPGDFVAEDHSGVPLLLVRGSDGVLRCFLNACRHRGARVAEGEGRAARTFACPYHAWSYGLDGRLLGRPNAAAFAGDGDCALLPVPVSEQYGMIWVSLEGKGQPDIEAALCGMGAELAAYRLDGYSHFRTEAFKARCNWKLFVDGFLELYHLAALHKGTANKFIHSDLGTYDGYGPHLRLIGARRSFREMAKQPEAEWDLIRYSAVIYVLFPNSVLIAQGDHMEMWHCYPDPEDPASTTIIFSLYSPEPSLTPAQDAYWEKNVKLALDTVQAEDLVISAGMQRNFEAGLQRSIVFGRNEPCLQHFHKALDSALGVTPQAA